MRQVVCHNRKANKSKDRKSPFVLSHGFQARPLRRVAVCFGKVQDTQTEKSTPAARPWNLKNLLRAKQEKGVCYRTGARDTCAGHSRSHRVVRGTTLYVEKLRFHRCFLSVVDTTRRWSALENVAARHPFLPSKRTLVTVRQRANETTARQEIVLNCRAQNKCEYPPQCGNRPFVSAHLNDFRAGFLESSFLCVYKTQSAADIIGFSFTVNEIIYVFFTAFSDAACF